MPYYQVEYPWTGEFTSGKSAVFSSGGVVFPAVVDVVECNCLLARGLWNLQKGSWRLPGKGLAVFGSRSQVRKDQDGQIVHQSPQHP